MKAYRVWVKGYDEGGENIVFAENRNQAKSKALKDDCIFNNGEWVGDLEVEYIDICANRFKALDALKSQPPMKIAEKLILDYGWYWRFDPDDKIYDSDNFVEDDFEKEWARKER